jgi:protein-S-isoprenylcysteine O-methyltransferase Ste14
MIPPIVLTSFGALLLVGGYHRRRAETGEPLNRRLEGWGILIGIRLTALALFVVLCRLLWNPSAFSFAALPPEPVVRWLGAAMVVLSTGWMTWMYRTLGSNITDTVVTRREAHFVCSGPYRYVRNPMYVGLLALTVGTGLALGNWLPAFGGVAVFTMLAIRTRTEERFLLARFPAEYPRYMAEVGRFWPKRSARPTR